MWGLNFQSLWTLPQLTAFNLLFPYCVWWKTWAISMKSLQTYGYKHFYVIDVANESMLAEHWVLLGSKSWLLSIHLVLIHLGAFGMFLFRYEHSVIDCEFSSFILSLFFSSLLHSSLVSICRNGWPDTSNLHEVCYIWIKNDTPLTSHHPTGGWLNSEWSPSSAEWWLLREYALLMTQSYLLPCFLYISHLLFCRSQLTHSKY